MSGILVVDDHVATRVAIAKLLERKGYSVNTAENGKDAWVTFYSGVPDLVVLDLMMPQMDGITFLRMLRNNHHWSHVPVLVLTAVEKDDELVQQAKELGVVDVILKGSEIADQLLARVAGVLPQPKGVRTEKRQLVAV